MSFNRPTGKLSITMFGFLQRFHHTEQALKPGALMRAAGLSAADYESAELQLARDVERLDVQMPEWTRDVDESDAMLRLSRGMSTIDAVAIFGADVVRQAYQRLATLPLVDEAPAAAVEDHRREFERSAALA